jgi:hypothetical protein
MRSSYEAMKGASSQRVASWTEMLVLQHLKRVLDERAFWNAPVFNVSMMENIKVKIQGYLPAIHSPQ